MSGQWRKLGCIFTSCGQHPWMISHAQVPVADPISGDTVRIFFASRDSSNRSVVSFIDTDAEDPACIRRLAEKPALGLGGTGCFDDSGVMPSWLVTHGGRKLLYYTGVNTSTSVPGHSAIGIAEWDQQAERFERLFQGPILDRVPEEPYLSMSPCVLPGTPWRMWYSTGTEWAIVDGRPEPCYNIRYAESQDGIAWRRPGHVCIDFQNASEGGLGRPSVIAGADSYKMWFCARERAKYRSDAAASYRIAYAESCDGVHWTRMDERAGIERDAAGWDSEMQAYPFVYRIRDRWYMLYNGNGFGRSGIGCAVLHETEAG